MDYCASRLHVRLSLTKSGRMTMNLDTKLCLGGDHVTTSIGSETAVMSIARSRYYAVGGVAEHIWHMLEQPISPREITDQLVAEYDVMPERCAEEVADFLGKLMDEGLVVEAH